MYTEAQAALDEAILVMGTSVLVNPGAITFNGIYDKQEDTFELEMPGERNVTKYVLVVSKTDRPTGISKTSTVAIGSGGVPHKIRGNPVEDEISFTYVLVKNTA